MRNVLLGGILILASVVAMPALASYLSVHEDNGQGSLKWKSGKDALVLRSGDGKGVHVIEVNPEGNFGLRAADDILAVDGKAVDGISALLNKLRASKSATADLLLIRNGSQRSVTIKVHDNKRLMPPESPTPPALPLPPGAPPPPPAPSASGG